MKFLVIGASGFVGKHIFECFGFDRTVFGSDWPAAVRARAADFYQCIEMVKKVIKGASDEDKQKLFYHNAINFYNL